MRAIWHRVLYIRNMHVELWSQNVLDALKPLRKRRKRRQRGNQVIKQMGHDHNQCTLAYFHDSFGIQPAVHSRADPSILP